MAELIPAARDRRSHARGPGGALWLLTAAALLVSGCDGCEDERAVPFKRGSSVSAKAAKPADGGTGAATAFEPVDGQRHDEPLASISIDGATLALAPAVALASLAIDLDQDGDRDLLLVTREGEAPPQLAVSTRAEAAWSAPASIAALSADDERCELSELELRAFDASYASLAANATCEDSGADGAAAQAAGAATPGQTEPPPEPATAKREPPPVPEDQLPPGPVAEPERRLWVIALGARPRVLQRFAVLAPGPERPRASLELAAADLDDDGHRDLRLDVSVTPAGEAETRRFELGYYNRPGGLARDDTEPEATLRTLANDARVRLKRDASKALGEARDVLALHRALCSEGGEPVLRVGTTGGLACGRSLGAGRAASIAVAALARAGKVFEALELAGELDHAAYQLTDNDRSRADGAVAAMVDLAGRRWRSGPTHAPGRLPRVHRATLAFDGEELLRLRGDGVASHDLRDGTTTPVGVDDPVLLTDPSGTLAVVDVFRSCDGYHLRIASTTQIAAGVIAGPARATPRIAPHPAPPGAHCPALPPALAADDGGYRPLAWTARGVLLARGQTLSWLALDAQGNASADAEPIAADAALTLPPLIGPLTPTGGEYALITRLGVAVVNRAKGVTQLLPPPEGVDASALEDVALSPSGRRIAVLARGRVYVAEPAPITAVAPPSVETPQQTAPAR